MSKGKIITVLLTRYYSAFSNFIYFVGGRGYTHASIALDEENECYYSFNFMGFRREYPKKHKNRSGKSISFKLEVSLEDYKKMQEKIMEMEQKKEELHYSRMGVFFCLFQIPFRKENYYFCSQFVAEMIAMSKEVALRKEPSLYFPNELIDELKRQSSLRGIVCNSI